MGYAVKVQRLAEEGKRMYFWNNEAAYDNKGFRIATIAWRTLKSATLTVKIYPRNLIYSPEAVVYINEQKIGSIEHAYFGEAGRTWDVTQILNNGVNTLTLDWDGAYIPGLPSVNITAYVDVVGDTIVVEPPLKPGEWPWWWWIVALGGSAAALIGIGGVIAYQEQQKMMMFMMMGRRREAPTPTPTYIPMPMPAYYPPPERKE